MSSLNWCCCGNSPETGAPGETSWYLVKRLLVHDGAETEEPKFLRALLWPSCRPRWIVWWKACLIWSRSRRKIRSHRMSRIQSLVEKWTLPRSNWMFWWKSNMTWSVNRSYNRHQSWRRNSCWERCKRLWRNCWLRGRMTLNVKDPLWWCICRKRQLCTRTAMDQVESVVEKVGTTLDQFTSSLTTLSSTIKDLSADQRSQGTRADWCFERNPLWDSRFQKTDPGPYTFQHAHHEQRDEERLAWQVSELRSGSVDGKGTVSAQKGSLLYVISEDLKTATQSTWLMQLAKSVKSVNETDRSWCQSREIVETEVWGVPRATTCGRSEKRKKKDFRKEQEEQRTPTSWLLLTGDPSLHRSADASDGRAKGSVHSWSGCYEAHGFSRWNNCSSPNRIYELELSTGTWPVPTCAHGCKVPPGPMPSMGQLRDLESWWTMNPGTPSTPSHPPGYVPLFYCPGFFACASKVNSTLKVKWEWNLWEDIVFWGLLWCGDRIFSFPESNFNSLELWPSAWFEKKGKLWVCVCFDMRVFRHVTFGFEVLKESW